MKIRNAKNVIGLSTLAALTLSTSFTHAAITGTSGGVLQIGAPLSANPGALTGITAFTWNEQTNVPLNIFTNMVNNPGNSNAAIPGFINGIYDSHFLHFEQIPGVVPVTGTVTFNLPIVAVIFGNNELDNTDFTAGSLGTIYPTTFPLRGLINAPTAFVTTNVNVLSFDLSTAFTFTNVAQVRIITQAPAPGSAALLGLAGLTCIRRRHR